MRAILRSPFVFGVAVALALLAALWAFGQARYTQGYNEARAAAVVAAAALEQGLTYDRDESTARYRGAVLAREATEKALADRDRRISGLLHQLRDAKNSTPSTGADGDGADWIGIFGACYAEYTELGVDAARVADKLRGLQDYADTVTKGAGR